MDSLPKIYQSFKANGNQKQSEATHRNTSLSNYNISGVTIFGIKKLLVAYHSIKIEFSTSIFYTISKEEKSQTGYTSRIIELL